MATRTKKPKGNAPKTGFRMNKKSGSYVGDVLRLRSDGNRVDYGVRLGDGISLTGSKSVLKILSAILG